MKKPFLIAVGFLLSATLGMSLNAIAYDREYPILEEVLGNAGIENTYNSDTKELKNLADPDAELPFENLYLYMVQNVEVGPHEAAVKEVAKASIPISVAGADGNVALGGFASNYTRNEIEQIVTNGDLSPITKNNRQVIKKDIEGDVEDGSVASVDFWEWKENNYSFQTVQNEVQEKTTAQVLLEYDSIMDRYRREYEFQRENRSLAYELLAGEMFWNGDLNDSAGVDIVSDLDLVHFVLFGNYMDLPDHTDHNVDLASEMLDMQDQAAAEWVLMRGDNAEGVSLNDSVMLAEEGSDPVTEDFDANTCYEDDDLRNAVEDFEDYVDTLNPDGTDPETGATPIVSTPPDDGSGSSGDSGSGGTTSSGDPDEDERDAAISDLSDALKVAKGEWTRGLPCNERFCITVDLKKASWGATAQEQGVVGAYDERDNCVACHVAFINDALKETMSKSMAPGKVSMNFFEDATCKESGTLINLDMNVYAIGKPIVLDPGDDLMEKAMSDLEDLETLLINARGLFKTDGTDITGKTAKDIACDPYFNLLDSTNSTGISLDQALIDCAQASDELASFTDNIIEEHQFETRALQNSSMYEVMSSQLYSMLLVIQELQKGLEATYKTEQKPLSSLQNKDYCN